jgi:RNA polymerase sigma factor FliA
VDRFDPERGCLLKTIAEHKIRGALLDYLRHVDPLPRNIRRFQKQRDAILAGLEASGRELRHDCVAERLGVSAVKYVALCRIVAAAEPISIQESPRALKLAG